MLSVFATRIYFMSYHIYTTDGIILKRKNFGEGNVFLYLLTKDLGLIIASAQSVRSHKSKLSSSLVDYSLVTVSCVKGKNGWKITNAAVRENFFFGSSLFAQNLLAQLSFVLIKMMPGEDVHKEIFDLIYESFSFLKYLLKENSSDFECVVMLRLLYHLGYVAKNESIEKFLLNDDLNQEVFVGVNNDRTNIINIINKGLKESHL